MISTAALKLYLAELGANLVGFADLTGISYHGLERGVAIAVCLSGDTVCGIQNGPTREYFDQYHLINAKLDKLAEAAASYLVRLGARALAQTTTAVEENTDYRTRMPHKTVARWAGLGWIGKSALLVTKEYGSAVRLTSVLTDAVFDQLAAPILGTPCESCLECTTHCPGKAISGKAWHVSLDRDDFFDPYACRKAARGLAADRIGEEITLCGKCIEVCPYTKAYLKREGKENS